MAHSIDGTSSRAFNRRSALMWLLGANALVFVALRLMAIGDVLSGNDMRMAQIIEKISLPAESTEAIARPWCWLTYMVTQYDAAHLMFNMLCLAWFGMLMHRRCGNGPLLAAYVCGGVSGGIGFLTWATVTGNGDAASGLIGASAAVMAVATGIAVIAPDMRVSLLFIGSAKLKWVTAVMLAIAVVCYSGYHAGSDAAHVGGMMAGGLFGAAYRRYHKRKRRPEPASLTASMPEASPLPAQESLSDNELLDNLLDKIRRSGYDSLSPDERAKLDSLSRRLNKS